MTRSAIIIEDEKLVSWSLSEHLKNLGFHPITTEYGREGVERARAEPPDLLFVDYRLPDITGLEVLERLQGISDMTAFFFMTAYGTNEISVQALKLGAREYLQKPLNFDEITLFIRRVLEERKQTHELNILKQWESKTYRLGNYISASPSMQKILGTVQKISTTDFGTVLLLGETGTGKDTLARVIHDHSPRKDKPFIVVNCASLSETLLESELFGHEKGAFTDAKMRKFGHVELADGGTVYLDEIGEIPIAFQAKLLRFIETHTFYRVGGTRELKVNVRIIASTNRVLLDEMKKKNFREDLYYRLNVISITLPPLRERKEDIPLLVNRFIEMYNEDFKFHVKGVSKDALDLLTVYEWPGNVRELKNMIERIFLLEKPEQIEPWHFPPNVRESINKSYPELGNIADEDSKSTSVVNFEGLTLPEVEREMLVWALRKTRGNQTRAARLLDITRDQVRYKIKKYNLQ